MWYVGCFLLGMGAVIAIGAISFFIGREDHCRRCNINLNFFMHRSYQAVCLCPNCLDLIDSNPSYFHRINEFKGVHYMLTNSARFNDMETLTFNILMTREANMIYEHGYYDGMKNAKDPV